MNRLSSGNPRIDEVLHGGLPASAINLVVGPPGSGKTILAEQYLFHNATEDRPAIYYSTVSEPHDKLLRYGQSQRFFDLDAVGRRVFFEPLGPDLRSGGLDAVVKRMAEDIKAHRPALIAVDSFRALAAFGDHHAFRSFLAEVGDLLTAFPVSAFWVGEYTPDHLTSAPEFAVADAVLALSREDAGLRDHRYFQVLKLRGSGFLPGKHLCRISEGGFEVFPRLADPTEGGSYDAATRRTSSGVAALDRLLHDGFLAGSTTLVAGPSGSGKTLLGLHFVLAGARDGEPGIVAAFQENPSQLGGIAAGFGWSLGQPGVEVLYTSMVDLYLDEWMHVLLGRIEATGARRVLVDSIGDLQAVTPDTVRFREFLYSFIQRCARTGVSVMLTLELPELFRVSRITEEAYSHLADNVVLLQYVPEEGTIQRALTVIKSRGTRHDPGVHRFDITGSGIVLAAPGAAGEPPPPR